MFNVPKIREDFPILKTKIHQKPLIYFDNAATSQKPQIVIDALVDYYTHTNANIHRGVHTLSQKATDFYERAREKIQKHFNAKYACEIILTAGTTHSINLVASSFTTLLTKGDEVIVSAMEHHSNIVPWQMLCERTGAILKVIPMNLDGTLQMQAYKSLLNEKTKMVFINHVSNALGTVNPIKQIIDLAHQFNAVVLVDGAQSCAHLKPDVQNLDVDFYVTSAHKMYGPTGVGVLYGKKPWLQKLLPYQGGGEMIKNVTFEKTTYADLPHKFEAGTPNIAGGIAFGAALDYLNGIGFENIANYEKKLLDYATEKLQKLPNIQLYGISTHKISVISFNFQNIHPYDVGTLLDKMGIATRTGHHCTQPIMDFYNIPGTVRASFAFYNTFEEIDIFVETLERVRKMLL